MGSRSFPKLSVRKSTAFRCLSVLFGLVLLGAVEMGLRLTGWGIPSDHGDPFVGFSSINPLFELNEETGQYQISKSRYAFFRPDSFAAKKGANEYRIFCLGGSTVQGRPYAIETSFTSWLELTLKAADPSREWQVVNCGGVSYASYRLVPIMQELLQHQPDMFIVYTGHNEFLEDRAYGKIKSTPDWIKSFYARLSNLRLFGVMQSALGQPEDVQPESARTTAELSAEVDALLDYQGGLEKYHRDDDWQAGVIAHYEHNLRRMIRIANRAHIPMMLANPISNLRDTPPFKCENQKELTVPELEAFQHVWEASKEASWDPINTKIKLVRQAIDIDPRFANAHFLLARCYEETRQFDEAKAAYIRAKDEDICPLRILEPMHEIVLRTAAQTRTPLVDAKRLLEEKSKNEIPGNVWLVDHVHPTIEGHQLIAKAFFEQMVKQRMAKVQPGMEQRKEDLFKRQFETLEPSYFPKSVERLNGLRIWTQGRVQQIAK